MEIKRYTLKGVNWALAGLLAMLGISCSGENGMNGHDTPTATYSIKRKVVNKQGVGIPNIGISIASNINDETYMPIKESNVNSVTAAKGSFIKEFSTPPASKIRIYVTDSDGDKNGTYAKDSTNITTNKNEYKGGSGWNSGKVSKNNFMDVCNNRFDAFRHLEWAAKANAKIAGYFAIAKATACICMDDDGNLLVCHYK